MTTTQERIAYIKKSYPRSVTTIKLLEDLPTAKTDYIRKHGTDTELKVMINNIDANILYHKLVDDGMSTLSAEKLLVKILKQTDYVTRSLDINKYTENITVR